MTEETVLEVRAILDRVYESGRTPLNSETVDKAEKDLRQIFERAFAGGVIWMSAVQTEVVDGAERFILSDIDAETVANIRRAQEVPYDLA